MKRKLLLLFFLSITVFFNQKLFSQPWTENFDTGLASSYTTGTQTLSTGDWYTVSVYQENSGDSNGGTGHAARINDDTNGASLRTPSLNTIGTVSFVYRELNSGGGTFVLQKSYDDITWTDITTQTYSGQTFTSFSYDVNDAASVVYIRILSDNNPGHLIIDDFSVTAFSGSSNDQTSTVTAPTTQLPAGTIPSIQTDSVPVFRFDITDPASGDGLPTNVTGMYFVAGPNNTIDFTQNLNGGGVYDLTNGAVIPVTGQPTVNANNVYLPVSLSIPDGGTVSVEAYLYINNTNAPDNGILQFQINSTSHGFTADASGSDFETTFAGGDIAGNDFTIQVDATQLTFTQQPADVVVNNVMAPAVQVSATDANSNVDTDYSGVITLTYSGTGTMGGTPSIAAGSGVAVFGDLTFDTAENGVSLSASDGTLNGTSNTFNVINEVGGADCANALSIDVGTHHATHTTTNDYDQWYVYHATADGIITVENCNSGYTGDTYLIIIEGSCGGTNFDEVDDVCDYLDSLSFDVTSGNDYYIGWGDYDTATPGEYDWTLSFRETIPIFNAYSSSSNELVLQYEAPLTSVDPADYTLTATGQTTINFSSATFAPSDHTVVYLTADTDIPANLIRDNINDAANNTSFQFYAGILPVSYTNTANAPDTVIQGYNLTLRGVVTANDAYNQVWIQDSNNPMSGVLIYSTSVQAMVNVGDTITFAGQKSFYNGLTEIVSPIIINPIINGGSATAATIDAADIEYNKAQDDATAEPWEGQLVTVSGITIDSLNASYYEYFGHDCNGNIVCFDDDADYHYGSGFHLGIDTMYNVTGVVTYSYGHYKINPRGTSDATEIIRDFTTIVEDPASQVTDAVIDVNIAVDSLHAVEILKFKVTDEGSDGLPTKISQFEIYTGPNNTVDFSGDVVAGGWFDFGDAANPIVFTGEPQFTTDHFTFALDPETAVIDNGTSKEVIMHIWFDPNFVTDESILQAKVSADPHGFVADCMNSQFASTFSADVVGGSLTLDTNVDINENDGKSISVYPNPSNGIFNINVSDNYKLEISDISGRIIKNEILHQGSSKIEITDAGIYFLTFSNNKTTYTRKVIVK